MNQKLRTQAWVRLGLFVVLALVALRTGVLAALGRYRDYEVQNQVLPTSALVLTLAVMAALIGACALAAYRIHKHEIQLPEPGTLRFPGGTNTLFSEVFLDLVAGALLLAPIFLLVNAPDAALSGPQRSGHSGLAPMIGFSLFFGAFGVLLLLLRRVIWELRPGQPIVRYWSRWLGRGVPMSSDLALYWEHYWGGSQTHRVVVAWCLKGKAGKKELEIALVPLETSELERQALLVSWQQAINGTARGAVQAADRNPYAPAVSATLPS